MNVFRCSNRCIWVIIFLNFSSYLFISGCKDEKKTEPEDHSIPDKIQSIEIVTNLMDFQMVDTIQSGWQNFRYSNRSKEPHFFLLDKYPEGKTIENGKSEVIPVFQEGMDLINEGKSQEAMEAFNKLPPWFSEIVFSGGSGLVSPGQISETILKLEPGYYVVECYVKMENGVFHSSAGMLKELIVTDENTKYEPPGQTVSITISIEDGIVMNDPVKEGKQVFSVFIKDQMVHENFVEHDINLVKLDINADLAALEKWMNWSDPMGLISPAPDGITFLGGVNDMPAGSKGYFIANLSHGNYALISEVPNAGTKNMLKTFSISE